MLKDKTLLTQLTILLMFARFISSAKAVGGKGFILSWTNLPPDSDKPECKY